MDSVNEMFLAVDGDDVGHRLEYFMLVNDSEALVEFSKIFQSAMNWLEIKLVSDFGAKLIFNGGDNLLASIPVDNSSLEVLEKLRAEFAEQARSTLSIGLGESPRQAYFALKLAKTSGKNCIRRFQELVNG
ncbi:mCpol domain-containing protein [Anabaena sp. CCY 0017]|uniref:mCpol domain-containing protein n=1 Tax=Anabaena sp. CCY 0017 TaxID=3103866 RepID=UPI0039C74CE8